MTNATLRGTSDAGNPRVRFDEGLRVRRNARRGATYLEYALLAALIGIVGAVGVAKYGKESSDFFSNLGAKTAEVNGALQK